MSGAANSLAYRRAAPQSIRQSASIAIPGNSPAMPRASSPMRSRSRTSYVVYGAAIVAAHSTPLSPARPRLTAWLLRHHVRSTALNAQQTTHSGATTHHCDAHTVRSRFRQISVQPMIDSIYYFLRARRICCRIFRHIQLRCTD